MAAQTLDRRRAGVLLHPSSLPGAGEMGALGTEARRFLDLLAETGFSVWQMLPLGPTHEDGSPYQSLSAFAGNPDLLDLEFLAREGWLESAAGARGEALAAARRGFERGADARWRARLAEFVAANAWWLEDYVLYRAIRSREGGQPWWRWPEALRDREPSALAALAAEHEEQLAQGRFEQFAFFAQWERLREESRRRGVLLFGDMPIFVAHDSAEVWARPDLFLLDRGGEPLYVAGVPPDYFSAEGQRWGNPLYDWERMAAEGFEWWRRRVEFQLGLFDLVRIDHFRGFEACWYVPAASDSARDGEWREVPGRALFERLHQDHDPLPLVAEDLGFITPQVHELRERFGLPGMKVLQFAFGGGSDNPYLPHNLQPNCVVYTGTHDNDTTLGWFRALDHAAPQRVLAYLGCEEGDMPGAMVRAAIASVARLAVIPLQDLLGLDGEHRMNTPGTTEGNWRWQFDWAQVEPGRLASVREWIGLYGRAPGDGSRP